MADFVHLHVHSDFSLLDGLSKVKDLTRAAADMEMPALALTDHGVMFGTLHFYHAAKKAGISVANPSDYYYLIRQCFPLYIYISQLLLFPLNVIHWSLYYLIRKKDMRTLRRFFSDSVTFILQRQKQSI